MKLIYVKYFFALVIIAITPMAMAVENPQPGRHLPFTREENEDGSKWVWFIMAQAGLNYEYITTRELPDSGFFLEVKKPQVGDVAWWCGYMAIFDTGKNEYITAESPRSLESLHKLFGKPKYFRFIVKENP